MLVREGEYVEIGSPIAKISDLNSIWIETQLYPDELLSFSSARSSTIVFEAFPSEEYFGIMVYNNPVLEENKKINLVRYRIANKENRIKPGMMANVGFQNRAKNSLVVARSSLVLGKMSFVWLKTGTNMFERRMIRTGVETKNEVEILEGVTEGEVVVVSGAYLLNSELILRQGGLKGHSHSD